MRSIILAASVALALGGGGAQAIVTGGSAGTASAATAGAGATTTATDPGVTNSSARFGPGGSFSNDSGNHELGTSPGQTSSGTAAGNSGAGITEGSASLGTTPNGAVAVGPVTGVAGDGMVGVVPGVDSGARVIAVPSNAAPQAPAYSVINTPIFDQAAREGRAREARRRARGEEPRVYGIAPRTENDLTWQMPDDRIIRY